MGDNSCPVIGLRLLSDDLTRRQAVTIIMYGIRNCDTIKKARAWLDSRPLEYGFHDYKVLGIERKDLERWCKELGWEAVLNRSGTTFRKLPESEKQALDLSRAVKLMLAQPSMIKRPVLEVDGHLLVGFKPEAYQAALAKYR
jgi:Spx/MgsR family transcriptional regulator